MPHSIELRSTDGMGSVASGKRLINQVVARMYRTKGIFNKSGKF